MNYMAEYERWLASPALTDKERAELEAIRGDEDAIKDRFFAPCLLAPPACAGCWASACIA